MRLLDQPFDAVAKPGPAADDPKAKALTEKIKKNWGEYKYVRAKEGRTLRYRAVMKTTAGDLVIDFFEGFSPDVVRNFITRLNSQAYDGQPISLEDNSLVFGPPVEKQAYTMPARPLPVPLPKGSVFASLSGDRAAGERFGIALKRVPGGGAKVSMFGRVSNPAMDTTLGQIVAELNKKPDSVVIKSAKIEVFDLPIFEGPEVRLPHLDKKGQLDIPDLAMYTGIANAEVNPRDQTIGRKSGADGGKESPDSLADRLIDSSTIKSKNPNVPSKSVEKPPKSP